MYMQTINFFGWVFLFEDILFCFGFYLDSFCNQFSHSGLESSI